MQYYKVNHGSGVSFPLILRCYNEVFLTNSQRSVLQLYWKTGRPFSLDTLLSDHIFSFRITARYSLWRMKRKNQIIQPTQGSGWYIATTDSSREWEQLHFAKK